VKNELNFAHEQKTSKINLIYKSAIKILLNKLITERNEKIYTLLGFCYKKTNKYNKAISYFERAIILNQNYFSAYYQMGLCALKLNKNCIAVNSFIKSIQTRPTHAHSVLNLGISHEICEEPDMALMIYQRLIETTPSYIKAYDRKASLLMNLSSFHEAIPLLNEMIKKNPTNLLAYEKLANCYKKIGKQTYANRCYRKIINTTSNNTVYDNAVRELKLINQQKARLETRQNLKLC